MQKTIISSLSFHFEHSLSNIHEQVYECFVEHIKLEEISSRYWRHTVVFLFYFKLIFLYFRIKFKRVIVTPIIKKLYYIKELATCLRHSTTKYYFFQTHNVFNYYLNTFIQYIVVNYREKTRQLLRVLDRYNYY